jgi:hypothetical protein
MQYELDETLTKLTELSEEFSEVDADTAKRMSRRVIEAEAASDGILMWFGFNRMGLDYHETWSGIHKSFIYKLLFETEHEDYSELAPLLVPFMQVRWVLFILSRMGQRLVIPTHLGQNDNRTMAMHYASLVMMAATRPQDYRGVSIDEY